ncbi:ead/Ea22-like family protein [Serratia liquefaciens]|uniref:ead/Ea22-like family protein n=1 Tax=Serratia liquefaciens TaxID=614 RepID=UPI0022B98877|nr:ead/Ea22-like family protein [Serratia liquefaciens]
MKLQDEFSELKAAALAATQGKWEMGAMPVTGQFGATSYIMSLVINTKGDSNLVHAVAAGVRCTAVTGTGPNSEHNARYIAAASPAVVLSLLAELEKTQKESVYFCNLNAQKNERIGEMEAAQSEASAKTLDRIADKMSKAMDELRVFDRILYANNIQVMRNVASIIRREAERMRDSKVPGDSVNTQDVNIGWLQRATPGAPE